MPPLFLSYWGEKESHKHGKQSTLPLSYSPTKFGANTWNLSTKEMESWSSFWAGGQSGVHSELQGTGLSYRIKNYLNKTTMENTTLDVVFNIQSSNCTLCYLHKEVENIYLQRKICTWIFTVVLFIVAQTWKQPQHPSGELINCDILRQLHIVQH